MIYLAPSPKPTAEDRIQAEEQLLEEQKQTRYDTKEFTVEVLVNLMDKAELTIPVYQREYVWPKRHRSRFVESLLMGIPIPILFGAQAKDGEIEIIDGVQRLRTLQEYLHGGFRLATLEKLDSLNGFRFQDLPVSQQRRLRHRSLRMVVLLDGGDLHTQFEIFERINTGSYNLKPSELRRGAFRGLFYDLVEELAESADFRRACPMSEKLRKRREGEELVLRFFAYSDRYTRFRHDVSRFLDSYLVDMNRSAAHTPEVLDEKRAEFERMIRFVADNFPNGFAKRARIRQTPRVRFEAIAVGVILALRRRPALGAPDLSWLDSQEFSQHTQTHASNSGPRLTGRIEFVRDSLLRSE